MRKITKSLLSLLLLCVAGVANVYADDEIELTKDMFFTWNGYGADAVSTSAANNVDFNIGNDVEVAAGGVICGTSTVDYLTYADLTGSTKLIITGSAGLPLRVLMNRQESNSGPLVEKNPVIGDDGVVELDLTDLTYVHINAIKVSWGASAGKVASIKMVKPSDPLAIPKENLKKAINQAKLQSPFAKTEESFAALTQAIADGEAALIDAAATAESLAASATAIENAIKALALKKGFTSLTTDFFQHWDAVANPTTGTAIEGCAYQLFVGSGLPYGDGNVGYLNFAKLTEYEKLYVTFASGTPRIMMNRDVDQGQWNADETQSHLIEYPKTGWVEKYFTNEDGVVTVDLAQIVADKGYANLNAIKGANWQDVTVTGMYLYKPVVPVAGPTFDFENNNGNWTIGEGADYAAGELTEENPITMDGITLTGVKGEATNAVRYFTNASKGNCLWIFKNNSIKLTAPEGKSITKIEFTMQTGSFDLTPSKGAVVDNVWTGKAVEVTFGPNAKGTRYVYAINVTVEDGVPATYTLAGAFKGTVGEEEASFFGEKWNPALDENLMGEQADGTYAISYDDVVFDQPGTIYFKVCENKSWDVSYGAYGQNAEKTVPVAGVYDITFTFNPAEGSVFCTLELDEIATGISNVNANAKKGQLYNLNGQQVMKAQKGLYILNGKKVILK